MILLADGELQHRAAGVALHQALVHFPGAVVPGDLAEDLGRRVLLTSARYFLEFIAAMAWAIFSK